MEAECKIDRSDAPNEWCKYCEEYCTARPKFPEKVVDWHGLEKILKENEDKERNSH